MGMTNAKTASASASASEVIDKLVMADYTSQIETFLYKNVEGKNTIKYASQSGASYINLFGGDSIPTTSTIIASSMAANTEYNISAYDYIRLETSISPGGTVELFGIVIT